MPSLMAFRMLGSDWYGMRQAMPPVSARAASSSGAVDAPVSTFTRNSSPRSLASVMRLASAPGSSLG